MTGRELIVYILTNNLEDEEIIGNGMFIGFMDENDAAVKFGVGVQTIRTWYNLGMIKGFEMGGSVYYPKNAVVEVHP